MITRIRKLHYTMETYNDEWRLKVQNGVFRTNKPDAVTILFQAYTLYMEAYDLQQRKNLISLNESRDKQRKKNTSLFYEI